MGTAEAIQAWLYTGRKKISGITSLEGWEWVQQRQFKPGYIQEEKKILGITRIRYFAVRRSNYKYKKKTPPKTD